jgi:hypothetical protein
MFSMIFLRVMILSFLLLPGPFVRGHTPQIPIFPRHKEPPTQEAVSWGERGPDEQGVFHQTIRSCIGFPISGGDRNATLTGQPY